VMNSTNGKQTLLTPLTNSSSSVTESGGGCIVNVEVTEFPSIVLWGQGPTPSTGPVPPITPAANGICKAVDGQALPTGVYCASALPVWANLTANDFVECPSGVIAQCTDGGVCTATGNGKAACTPDPTAFCNNRTLGLYCNPSWHKPAPDWPDQFVECPNNLPQLCNQTSPRCVQHDTTVQCSESE
jgi:hypothetical protein